MSSQNRTNEILLEILAELESMAETITMIEDALIPEPQADTFELEGVQKMVYELCDDQIDTKTISERIGKNPSDVRKAITRLRWKGLLKATGKPRSGKYQRTPLLWVRFPKSTSVGKDTESTRST